MRIGIVCDEYPPGPHGGLGTCARVLGRAFVERGHEVRVIGSYPAGYGGADHETDGGVRVWRLREPAHRLGWIQARAAVFRRIAAWARTGEIDVVEVADWRGPAALWPKLPVPVIVRMNGSMAFFASELGRPIAGTGLWLERASLRRADAWCAASRYTADRTAALFGLDRPPATVLYNPVEPPAEVPDPGIRSDCDVVFTGTLTAKKGVVSLIRAWRDVLSAVPQARLHLFGKDSATDDAPSMRALLLAELTGPGEAASVSFHGHVHRERLFEALRAARAAVFPSYAEAFGIAPFEAMARGCPTIYTSRQPGPELVRDQEDALLVDPDSPPQIAAAIVRLLTAREFAEALGHRGKRRVLTTFTSAVMVPRNLEFFNTVIEEFGQARRRAKDSATQRPAQAASLR